MNIKKFINRLAALMWLIGHSEDDLHLVVEDENHRWYYNSHFGAIKIISFVEILDEVKRKIPLNWFDIISPVSDSNTPWGDHKRTKHQAMSDHHFSWRFEKLLVPDKVHYYIYDGIKYSFTVKEYGLFTDNHGSPSVQVEVLMHEGSEIRYTTLLSVYSCVHEIVRHDPFRIYLMPPD
jgi:hypothetical protein